MSKKFEVKFNEKAFESQVKDLTKAYAQLDMRQQKKVMKRAFSRFARQGKLRQAFRARTPIGDDTNTWEGSRYKPGGLRKAVGTKVYFSKNNRGGVRPNQWVCKVGLMRSKKQRGYYGIMLQDGTVERFVGAGKNRDWRTGKPTKAARKAYKAGQLRSVGAISPQPFAAQAEKATLSAGRGSFLKHMVEALDYVMRVIPARPKKRRG